MTDEDILDSYDNGRVRLVYLGDEVERPFAVHPTTYGSHNIERFHSITAARGRFSELAKPLWKIRQPVCVDCGVVFRRDVKEQATYGTVFRGAKPNVKRTWACPCCGTVRWKKLLTDLPPEEQSVYNRQTAVFFHLRYRMRQFKDGY